MRSFRARPQGLPAYCLGPTRRPGSANVYNDPRPLTWHKTSARLNQQRSITLGLPPIPGAPDEDDTSTKDGDAHKSSLKNKLLESALTTFASLALLGLSGYAYHRYYKYITLDKITHAFQAGDPALDFHHNRHHFESASEGLEGAADHQFVIRDEQSEIDAIVHGKRAGSYYLIIGEKGNGKKGMLLNAMHKSQGEHCSIMDASSDLEIFRIRLGKTLDYEFAEDFIGGLFSIKGQRDAGPILDIERAFNKLEKVAIRHKRESGASHRPLILIFNNMHLIPDNEEGNVLLELLQQRAESFASSGLMTFVFNSDEYWVYERLRQNGRCMELLPVRDLPKEKALNAFSSYRFRLHRQVCSQDDLEAVWQAVGGRLRLLSKVAKEKDMHAKLRQFLRHEKTWVLNQSALIPDFDDDVLDDGKWQAGTFMLAQALVEEEKNNPPGEMEDLVSLPLYRCRQILTRADFMQKLDALNIITIDTDCNVRADSRAMMQAFREIVGEEDFQANLDNVMDRCNAVESLHRTRELVFKGIDENEDLQKGVVKVFYEKVAKPSEDDADETGEEKTRALKYIDGNVTAEEDDDDVFVVASRRED